MNIRGVVYIYQVHNLTSVLPSTVYSFSSIHLIYVHYNLHFIIHTYWTAMYLDFLIQHSTFTHWKLVLIKMGWPKKAGTASSMSGWVLMKFSVTSGKVLESIAHWPGRGSGTWWGEAMVVYMFYAYVWNLSWGRAREESICFCFQGKPESLWHIMFPVTTYIPTLSVSYITLVGWTGSQLAFDDACPLNGPSKVSMISCRVKAQTAEPGMEFSGVVKTPYTSIVPCPPYLPSTAFVAASVGRDECVYYLQGNKML